MRIYILFTYIYIYMSEYMYFLEKRYIMVANAVNGSCWIVNLRICRTGSICGVEAGTKTQNFLGFCNFSLLICKGNDLRLNCLHVSSCKESTNEMQLVSSSIPRGVVAGVKPNQTQPNLT